MSAVWRASRAAVRRRRLQTFVIGLVVLLSTASIVVALALLDASSAPFDRAFAERRGAHVVATYDAAAVTHAQLAEHRPDVTAVAGPFRQATVDTSRDGNVPRLQGRPLTVVGRADPGGPVDTVDVWHGRWATGPGEIVLNEAPPAAGYRAQFRPEDERVTLADGTTFTVVGRAYSISRTADAWVAPDRIAALRPTTTQMLYRFADARTTTDVDGHVAALRAGLPPDALIAAQSHLVVKEAIAAGPGAYVPFLVAFGVLGLIVAVLIVGNVVSGAVVSGYRHIGVLKAMGFTPRQVVAVYLAMVSVPAVVGCVLGTVLGDLGARPLLRSAFLGLGFGAEVGVAPWIDVAALVGAPAVVLLAALVPALRAYRLSAAEAISAGSAPRPGRALRVQRALGGTRLPRAVSLGLGLPFARPARTALTMAAVVLGVVTVTFATGMSETARRYSDLTDLNDTPIAVRPLRPDGDQPVTQRSVPDVEQLLRSVPGTTRVAGGLDLEVSIVGDREPATVYFVRGDVPAMGFQDQIVAGRWLRGPDEIVAPSTVLHDHGLSVGDRATIRFGARQRSVTVVGEIMSTAPGWPRLVAGWDTFERLAPDYRILPHEMYYALAVAPGTDTGQYLAAIRTADPGLDAWDNSGSNSYTTAVVALSTVLTLLLGLVAALGVFNTVVLNTRDRRRDLGMLKSIGMTPRQVVVMMVTSMAALGVVGGLLGVPLGVLAHRVVVPVTADAANLSLAKAMLQVWQPGGLVLLAVAGLAITVLGALLPARSAARLTIAEVLHNE
ncbi:FtsX-like permease family protein [Micromonospora sp. NPDC005087]|uniref:ABC transporter permease n=1 Tax=Micromonospora sp. NPDC005087 TaxID=3364225 RepID=UPI0036933E94